MPISFHQTHSDVTAIELVDEHAHIDLCELLPTDFLTFATQLPTLNETHIFLFLLKCFGSESTVRPAGFDSLLRSIMVLRHWHAAKPFLLSFLLLVPMRYVLMDIPRCVVLCLLRKVGLD